jgi:hypothetical protein
MDDNLFELFEDIEEDVPVKTTEIKEESKEELKKVVEKQEVEEELEEEVEEIDDQEVDPTSVKAIYTVLKEFGAVEETEEPTEDFIRGQLQSLREKEFLNYVKSLPEYMQSTLVWAAEKGNVTKEEFVKFVSDFVVIEEQPDLEDIEGARQYLKTRKQFKTLFDSDEDVDAALDILEDRGKLLAKAKEFYNKEESFKQEETKKQIETVKAEKAAKAQKEKEFAYNVQKELDAFQWSDNKKEEVIPYLNAQKINETWQQIVNSPKAFAQFGDILSHFENGSFDKLYNILEGKQATKKNKEKLSAIEKDSLSKLLKGNQEVKEKIQHDDSWWQ